MALKGLLSQVSESSGEPTRDSGDPKLDAEMLARSRWRSAWRTQSSRMLLVPLGISSAPIRYDICLKCYHINFTSSNVFWKKLLNMIPLDRRLVLAIASSHWALCQQKRSFFILSCHSTSDPAIRNSPRSQTFLTSSFWSVIRSRNEAAIFSCWQI